MTSFVQGFTDAYGQYRAQDAGHEMPSNGCSYVAILAQARICVRVLHMSMSLKTVAESNTYFIF